MEKWYRIEFKIKWDKSFPVNFHIDLIIIDLLINPVVRKFKFNLWTIHRSAHPTDIDGHMLKFNFYTTEDIAKELFRYVESHEDYDTIKRYLEDNGVKFRDDIGGFASIGDENWPSEIRMCWPYYIKGVSEMFLNLIEEIRNKKPANIDKNNSEKLETYYKEVEKEIDGNWLEYGCHAFFHHLSAVIGYKPVKPQIRGANQTSGGLIF